MAFEPTGVMQMSVRQLMAGVVIALGMFSVPAGAVTFNGSSGSLSASADFEIVGNNLQVTLTNTSTADTLVPADVLTAVMWTGTSGLTPLSALLAAGSTVFYDPQGQPAGGNVGGEWGYAQNTGPGGDKQGISSSGVGGWFSSANFNGPDLESPAALDGLQYGIVSAGDNIATGNAGITGSGGLIKNSVVFTLSGLPANFALTTIANVFFQYGTAQDEPRFGGTCTQGEPGCYLNVVPPTVPVPAALPLLLTALGLGGIASLRRRRKA
ncbi:MAG: PEP-CTERM sorting domain-containing protein [Alphaproteobacteria bacterium]|nr:PEP-CTERM sorting domain-containing protein [Alphaproteobacteria bacterium]